MHGQSVAPGAIWSPADLPLDRWQSFASDELDAVHQHMARAFCPHDLATEGGVPPLKFRHNQANLRSSTFNATDYGLPYGRVALFIPPSEESFLVQLALSGQAQFSHQGKTFVLRPGYLSVLSPQESIRQVTDAGCRHFTIKVDRAQMEALLREDFGYRPKPLIFEPEPVPILDSAGSFMRFVRAIIDDMEEGFGGYLHPRAIATTEAMLGRLLLAAVPHNHTHDYLSERHSGATPYYVRRAEEFIRTHYCESLSLSDLVEAAGVSGRSLHFGFRKFRDDSPMGYLKRYRLERARRSLLNGAPGLLTVTEVALASGFAHPGKFTQDYARRFGELPSATLQKGRA